MERDPTVVTIVTILKEYDGKPVCVCAFFFVCMYVYNYLLESEDAWRRMATR